MEVHLTEGGRVKGTHSSRLTITDARSADSAAYDVVVRNKYGQITSPPRR